MNDNPLQKSLDRIEKENRSSFIAIAVMFFVLTLALTFAFTKLENKLEHIRIEQTKQVTTDDATN